MPEQVRRLKVGKKKRTSHPPGRGNKLLTQPCAFIHYSLKLIEIRGINVLKNKGGVLL